MVNPDTPHGRALYVTLPICAVAVILYLVLDYQEGGRIDGSMSDGAGYFYALIVLAPVMIISLPWSILGIGLVWALVAAFPSVVAKVATFVAFPTIILAGIYLNAYWIFGRRTQPIMRDISKTLGVVYVIIPVVLAVFLLAFYLMSSLLR